MAPRSAEGRAPAQLHRKVQRRLPLEDLTSVARGGGLAGLLPELNPVQSCFVTAELHGSFPLQATPSLP